MNKKLSVKQLVLLGLLTAILLLMSYTPLGYLNIGPLAITFNVVPVAIGAVALGPVGGTILGGVFGLTSFLQCLGIGLTNAFAITLFEINPLFAAILCFIPRILDGLFLGLIFKPLKKLINTYAASFIVGFCAALFNTIMFMTALVLLYGNTEYLQSMINGQNILAFVCAFVGVNAVFEMIASTILTGGVCSALYKAKLLTQDKKKTTKAE